MKPSKEFLETVNFFPFITCIFLAGHLAWIKEYALLAWMVLFIYLAAGWFLVVSLKVEEGIK